MIALMMWIAAKKNTNKTEEPPLGYYAQIINPSGKAL
jgi:hypothetical protein